MVCSSGMSRSRQPFPPRTTAYTSSRTSYSLLNKFAPTKPEAPVTRIGPFRARIFDFQRNHSQRLARRGQHRRRVEPGLRSHKFLGAVAAVVVGARTQVRKALRRAPAFAQIQQKLRGERSLTDMFFDDDEPAMTSPACSAASPGSDSDPGAIRRRPTDLAAPQRGWPRRIRCTCR